MWLKSLWFCAFLPLYVCKDLCKNNSHIHGEWIIDDTMVNKSFVCCGGGLGYAGSRGPPYDFQNIPSNYCHQEHTLPFFIENGYVGLSSQCNDDCCICDRTDNTRFEINQREKFIWVPTDCEMTRWNATQLCEKLSSRTLLLLGDSTMQQTASTLMSMVSANGGQCGEQIKYGRTDFLFGFGTGNHELPNFIEKVEPDLLILTAGAHIHDTGDLYHIFNSFSEYITKRNERGMKIPSTIIWKTQNPGHLNCLTAELPYKSDGNQNAASDPLHEKYNWKRFQEFDDMARRSAHDFNISAVLDMSPLYLRPDGHIRGEHQDCLHYCQPGPLNVFSVLLLQMFLNGEIV